MLVWLLRFARELLGGAAGRCGREEIVGSTGACEPSRSWQVAEAPAPVVAPECDGALHVVPRRPQLAGGTNAFAARRGATATMKTLTGTRSQLATEALRTSGGGRAVNERRRRARLELTSRWAGSQRLRRCQHLLERSGFALSPEIQR